MIRKDWNLKVKLKDWGFSKNPILEKESWKFSFQLFSVIILLVV